MNNQLLKISTGLALICASVTINTGIANQMVLAKTKTPTKCNIYAYVDVSSGQALNVRTGPSMQNKILGQVPVNETVNVIAVVSNWARITNASGGYKGTGWVSLPKLGLSTTGYGTKGVRLYAKTNQNSQVILRVPSSTSVNLLGCQGGWALIEYKGIKGWLTREDQCGAALTTCS